MGQIQGTQLADTEIQAGRYRYRSHSSQEMENLVEEPAKGNIGAISLENLVLELGLILGLACICVILFVVYLAMAKVEDIPREYFMKNKLPLIKKVRQVKKEIKKLGKIEEEVYLH